MKASDKRAIHDSTRGYVDDSRDQPKRAGPVNAITIAHELTWFFNDAAADLGLSSSHETLVAMANAGGGTHSVSTDGIEARLERNQLSAKRYRRIADVLHRLSRRSQRDLLHAFERHQWPAELGGRPKEHVRLAAHSTPIRTWFEENKPKIERRVRRQERASTLSELRRSTWSERNGLLLLVLAEKPPEVENAGTWTALRVAAWLSARDSLFTALEAFAESFESRKATEGRLRDRRVAKLKAAS